MSANAPRATRWPLVTLLATGSCFNVGPRCEPIGPIEPPCPSNSYACAGFSPRTVAQATARFEGVCPSSTCGATAERGNVASAPAVHPAEYALAISASSIASIRIGTFEPADGAGVFGFVRCEVGGSLVLLGDQYTAIRSRIEVTPNWTVFVAPIRAPSRNFVVASDAIVAPTLATVRFENTGTGQCFVSRLVYETTANVCSRSICLVSPDVIRPPRDGVADVPLPTHDVADGLDADALDDAWDERDAEIDAAYTDASTDAATEDTTDRDASLDAADDAVEADTRESPDSADGV
ncbi:MAG: hypothetical protein JNK05_20925 [Myxococcales bacterium]|nr:hypothetical protein [Myxococcales bacterium]